MKIDYSNSIQENIEMNRAVNERIIATYHKILEQRQEQKEYQLIWRCFDHLKQRMAYYTEFIPEEMYTPEEYVDLCIRDVLFCNCDIYPYAGSYWDGPYSGEVDSLRRWGLKYYKEHFHFPKWESTIVGKEQKERRTKVQLKLL